MNFVYVMIVFVYMTTDTHRFALLSSRLSKHNKRIIYTVLEYDPLLDSSNMTTDDWGKIGVDIEVSDSEFMSFLNFI